MHIGSNLNNDLLNIEENPMFKCHEMQIYDLLYASNEYPITNNDRYFNYRKLKMV